MIKAKRFKFQVLNPLFLLLFLLMTLEGNVQADTTQSNEPVIVRTLESVKGQVTRVEGNTIDLFYDQRGNAEYEMHLPVDEKVELQHYRKFSEIHQGDEVVIEYEKATTNPKTPQEQMTMRVKKISFMRRPKDSNTSQSEEIK